MSGESGQVPWNVFEHLEPLNSSEAVLDLTGIQAEEEVPVNCGSSEYNEALVMAAVVNNTARDSNESARSSLACVTADEEVEHTCIQALGPAFRYRETNNGFQNNASREEVFVRQSSVVFEQHSDDGCSAVQNTEDQRTRSSQGIVDEDHNVVLEEANKTGTHLQEDRKVSCRDRHETGSVKAQVNSVRHARENYAGWAEVTSQRINLDTTVLRTRMCAEDIPEHQTQQPAGHSDRGELTATFNGVKDYECDFISTRSSTDLSSPKVNNEASKHIADSAPTLPSDYAGLETKEVNVNFLMVDYPTENEGSCSLTLDEVGVRTGFYGLSRSAKDLPRAVDDNYADIDKQEYKDCGCVQDQIECKMPSSGTDCFMSIGVGDNEASSSTRSPKRQGCLDPGSRSVTPDQGDFARGNLVYQNTMSVADEERTGVKKVDVKDNEKWELVGASGTHGMTEILPKGDTSGDQRLVRDVWELRSEAVTAEHTGAFLEPDTLEVMGRNSAACFRDSCDLLCISGDDNVNSEALLLTSPLGTSTEGDAVSVNMRDSEPPTTNSISSLSAALDVDGDVSWKVSAQYAERSDPCSSETPLGNLVARQCHDHGLCAKPTLSRDKQSPLSHFSLEHSANRQLSSDSTEPTRGSTAEQSDCEDSSSSLDKAISEAKRAYKEQLDAISFEFNAFTWKEDSEDFTAANTFQNKELNALVDNNTPYQDTGLGRKDKDIHFQNFKSTRKHKCTVPAVRGMPIETKCIVKSGSDLSRTQAVDKAELLERFASASRMTLDNVVFVQCRTGSSDVQLSKSIDIANFGNFGKAVSAILKDIPVVYCYTGCHRT